MTEAQLVIQSNREIGKNTYEMVLTGETGEIRPGQFVDIRLPGYYLRRPISVCDFAPGRLTLIYKVVGHGTEYMAGLTPGAALDVLTGLGNGYDTAPSGERPLLIGGGACVPPLYALAKRLLAEGKRPRAILGFNTADEVFYPEEFLALGVPVTVTTVDGSRGVRGFVTDAMDGGYTYFYTCGPEAMMRAVFQKSVTSGQFSLEERMGCGFGACMGCTCRTKTGHKRVCKDGPVFVKEELAW